MGGVTGGRKTDPCRPAHRLCPLVAGRLQPAQPGPAGDARHRDCGERVGCDRGGGGGVQGPRAAMMEGQGGEAVRRQRAESWRTTSSQQCCQASQRRQQAAAGTRALQTNRRLARQPRPRQPPGPEERAAPRARPARPGQADPAAAAAAAAAAALSASVQWRQCACAWPGLSFMACVLVGSCVWLDGVWAGGWG